MKRIWIWLLCIVLAFSLTACNGCNETTDPAGDPNASVGEDSGATDNSNPTEGGDTTTGNDAADGGSTTEGKNTGATQSADGGKNTTTASGNTTTGKTEASQSGSTTGSQNGSTTAGTTSGANAGTSTGTTKAPESAPGDNVVDWGEIFGTESTQSTTTTTTKPTTTTTVKPTEAAGVKFPAVGTDVDVVKQKGRYRISESKLSDDNKTWTITIKNEDKNWINQETDWVKFACYDKNGNELKGEGNDFGYIYIGALKIGGTFTQTITLPAGTAEIKLVDSEIVYWTDWK